MTKEQFRKIKEYLTDEERQILNKWVEWFYSSDKYMYYDFYEEVEFFIKTSFQNATAKWNINEDGYYPVCSNCRYEPKRNEVLKKICPKCGKLMK